MRISSLRWATRHFKVDYGLFDPDRHPPAVPILRTLDTRRGVVVGIIAEAQGYKTLVTTIWVLAQLALRTVKIGWYSVTEKEVLDWAEQKLEPREAEIEPLQRAAVALLRANKKYEASNMELLSASTKGDRQQRSLHIVVGDENWIYRPGALREILNRVTSYLSRSTCILPSTGGMHGDDMHELFKGAEQWFWHFQCPACESFFYPEFFKPKMVQPSEKRNDCGDEIKVDAIKLWQPWGGLHFETGESVRSAAGGFNWPELYKTVAYQCPHCGEKIPYSLQRMRELDRAGRFLNVNPEGEPCTIFFHSNALRSVAWTQLAKEFLMACYAKDQGDPAPYEVFIKTRLAKFFKYGDLFEDNREGGNYGEYDWGDDWADEVRRFAVIDVQKDHYWMLIRAFARGGKSRLIACGKVLSEEHLRELLKKYNCNGHDGVIEMDESGDISIPRGCNVFIDGNYSPSPGEVVRLAASIHAIVLRGDDVKPYVHADGRRRIYSAIKAVQAFEGLDQKDRPADRVVCEVHFSNNSARNLLQFIRQQVSPEMIWTYPRNVEEKCPDYLKHMGAWVPEVRLRAKDGVDILNWKKVSKRDDLFWCEKGAIVAASMANLIGAAQAVSAIGSGDSDPALGEDEQ